MPNDATCSHPIVSRPPLSLVYGSVCSGIEAASVAWHLLGWRAAFLAEIDQFARAVLAERFPAVPLHGDFTTIKRGGNSMAVPCMHWIGKRIALIQSLISSARAQLDDQTGGNIGQTDME